MLAHGDALCEKHPKLRRMFNHLRKMNTKAFTIAVLEELILLVVITVYVFCGGPYAIELWTAAFMAFSIHLIVHIGQAIVVRGYVPGLVTSILLLPFSYIGIQSIWNTFSTVHSGKFGFCTLVGDEVSKNQIREAWVRCGTCGTDAIRRARAVSTAMCIGAMRSLRRTPIS